MSYNTADSTNNVVGVAFNQAQLDEAFSIMNRASRLRWSETTITETFSSEDFSINRDQSFVDFKFRETAHNIGLVSIWLQYPVVSISSFVIGETSQTEGTDYELTEETGQVSLLTMDGIGDDKEVPIGDISITYSYGYTSAHKDFAMVKGIEARIALLLLRDPLLTSEINLSGDVCKFGDDPLGNQLKRLPKTFGLTPVGRGFSA